MEVWGFWISVAALILGAVSAWPILYKGLRSASTSYADLAKSAETKREITLRIAKNEPCSLISYVSFRTLSAIIITWLSTQHLTLLFSFGNDWIKALSMVVSILLFMVAGRLIGDALGITFVIVRERLAIETDWPDQ